MKIEKNIPINGVWGKHLSLVAKMEEGDSVLCKNEKEANTFLETGQVPSSQTVTNRDKPPLSFEQQLAQNLQGVGQRDFGERDRRTLLTLKDKGYDTSGISRFDQSDFLRDLRIGHAWDTGKGTIMYKPNRGMMQIIRKKKEEA